MNLRPGSVVTEEVAKTKACCGPPAIAAATLLARKDVEAKPLEGLTWGLCIASACMAWRPAVIPDPGVGKPGGFCGLAGAAK